MGNFLIRAKKENIFNLPLIFLLISSLIYFSINSDNTFDWIFGDRALLRAKNLLNEFQFYGAEINNGYGKRIWGGFSYYYLFFLINLSKKPEIIYAINFLFISLSILILIFSISKAKNIFTGVVSAILLITSYRIMINLIQIWNPTFGFGFYLLAISLYINFLVNKKKKWLIFSIILFLISAQFHISYSAPLFLILIENFFTKRVNTIYLIQIIVGSFFITYSPLIFDFLFGKLDSLEFFLEYFKNLSVADYTKYSLRNFIALLYKSQSFVQDNTGIVLKIPLMMILTTIFAIYLLLVQNKKKEIKEYSYLFSILAFFYILLFIFHLWKDFQFVIGSSNRYLLFVAPIHAIICGFGFNIIFNYYLKTKKFWISYFVISIILLKIIAFNLIVFNENKLFKVDKNFISIKTKNSLLDKINFHYNTDSNYLINNFSIGTIENDNLNFRFFPFQYQIENYKFDNTNKKNKLNNCLIAIYNRSKKGSEFYNIKKVVNEIGKLEKLIEFDEFYLIEYKSKDNFCINNMSNHYILTLDEKISLDNQSVNSLDVNQIIKQNQMNFFFMIKDHQNKPIDIYIKLSIQEQNFIKAELISKRLRNSMTLLNGFWKKTTINKPELIFKSKNTQEMSIIFYKGVIGEMITTPIIKKNQAINFSEIIISDIYFNYEIDQKRYSVKLNNDNFKR